MGAVSLDFTIEGRASRSEIEKAFRRQVASDAAENGHRQGYSGDFQTISGVDYAYLGQEFSDLIAAQDFALEHSEKWGHAVAVYFKTENGAVDTLVAGWGAC